MLAPVAAALLALGAVPRLTAQARAERAAGDNAEPSVRVVHPSDPGAAAEVSLPATLLPWAETSIRARSAGYVSGWSVDIGAHVRAGQTLATIVAPELADALRQARADEAGARSNLELADATATRWQDMLRRNATSQQEAQQKTADLAARRAQLAAAQANVARLAQQLAYTRVVAPFDGVITARNVDVGTLVDPSAAAELFHEVQSTRLRALVAVPDDVAPGIHAGLPAQVVAGPRTIAATIARAAPSLDTASRMLRAEVDVPNPEGLLLPGQYVDVRTRPAVAGAGSSLPIEAILYRPGGPTIAVVDAAGSIALQSVRVDHDLGTRVIVTPALPATLDVVVSPGDAIEAGQKVRVAAPATARVAS